MYKLTQDSEFIHIIMYAMKGNGSGPSGSRDLNDYLPLHRAAIKGDWEAAKNFLDKNPNAENAIITGYSGTALHVAAAAGHSRFIKKLVHIMTTESLAIQDSRTGATALHYAAVAGITEAAIAMVSKNNNLTQICVRSGWTPLHLAAAYAANEKKDMIWYLCTATRDEGQSPFAEHLGSQLICNIVSAGFYDIALYLLDTYPLLLIQRDANGRSLLEVLARKPSAFPSGSQLGFWQRCIYSTIPGKLVYRPAGRHLERQNTPEQNCTQRFGEYLISNIRGAVIKIRLSWTYLTQASGIKQVYQTKMAHVQALELLRRICTQISQMNHQEMTEFFSHSATLSTAAEFGIVEVLEECLQTFPDQIWFLSKERSIFHIAVEHRQEKVFNLMFGMSSHKTFLAFLLISQSNNNILHLAAKLPLSQENSSVPGPALQMQRELQLYKEVEKIAQPIFPNLVNQNMETPRELFTKEHKDLLEKAEKWMKDTAQSSMVVATLIATVVFTAIFTIPGGSISDGNNHDKGLPIFLHKDSFIYFMVADTLALFSSLTSVLMFLSILTSRYAEEDFLYSLPKKLIIGLSALFFSIAAMMVAFTATICTLLKPKYTWAYLPVGTLSWLIVIVFGMLQFPLVFEIIRSTYGPGFFHVNRHNKYKLH